MILLLRRRPKPGITPAPTRSLTVKAAEPIQAAKMPPPVAAPLRKPKMPANEMKGKVVLTQVEARTKALEALAAIKESEQAIDRATERIDAAHQELDAIMRQFKWPVIDDGEYAAKLEEHYSRQTRVVDPQKFRNAVSADSFWSCITVNITRAAEVLSEKEITAIADVVPAASLGYRVTVKPIKRRGR